MIDFDSTINQALQAMGEIGAGCLKWTFNDKKGKPMGALILVSGRTESEEVLEAVQAIEDSWHGGGSHGNG